jgi:hypothetical protein
MAAEKFFENGGRPIDIVMDQSTGHFVNGTKSEADMTTDVLNGACGNDRRGSTSPLPTPASACSPKPRYKLSAAAIIPVWIVLSSSVIIYNNYLYNTLNFRFPVFLVTYHLGFAVRALSPLPPCLARQSNAATFLYYRRSARAYCSGQRASSMARRISTSPRTRSCAPSFPSASYSAEASS